MTLELLAPICSIVALLFALYLALKVLKKSEGNPQMIEIS